MRIKHTETPQIETNRNMFTVRENILSDRSLTYDVLVNGEELYAATSEDDAYALRDELRDALIKREAKSQGVVDFEKLPLYKRLNALSYKFGFDSAEARTICEAAALAKAEGDSK